MSHRAAGWTCAALLAAALCAPWVAPHPPRRQEDVAGARLLPPLSRAHALRLDADRVRVVQDLRRTEEGWEFRRAGRPDRLRFDEVGGAAPQPRLYLLGTDSLGRDLASRTLFGARHSVVVAGLCAVLALTLGAGIGAASGLAGGIWDALLMRGVDMLMSIPRVLLFLVCAALFGPSTWLLVLALGATTWTGVARIVRTETLALRSGDLALSARASGAAAPRVLLRHLLPQMAPTLAVAVTLRFADVLLAESALAFLGLGSPAPAISLGDIIAGGGGFLETAPWIVAVPGAAIVILVTTVRLAGSRLLRAPDPASLA